MIQELKDRVRHRTPDALYPIISMPYFHLHPKRDSSVITKDGSLWRARNIRRDKILYYPFSQNAGRIAKSAVEKGSLYQLPGQVEVEPSDTVVETGAYVGEFTSPIASTAGEILAIEPDPNSAECLAKNTNQYDNVLVTEALLDSEPGERRFQLGTDPTENSMFGLDAGNERGAVTIETDTLANVCDDNGIDHIDFLKLEAEGAEPEILLGADEIPIQKIAAGVGPERNGQQTRSEVIEILTDRDYKIVDEKNNVLFAIAD